MSGITPSQTVGPFFAYGLTPQGGNTTGRIIATGNLITPDVVGDRIRIEGIVRDGDGVPIHDAMIEIWQADGQGRYCRSGGNGAAAEHVVQGLRPLSDATRTASSGSTP